MNNQPIGIFDSGLGGLNVLTELHRELPQESFVYLGDTARIPYGTKSPQTLKRYIEQNVQFLKKQNCKAVVVACNSASTVLDPKIFDLPVLGVIRPGAKEASLVTKNKKVGVIATKTTVQQKAYVTAIQEQDPEIQVFQQAAPLLVPLVEESWFDDPITNLVVYRYLSPLMASQIDTLVLGCTHFPFLLKPIQKVVGPAVTTVHSGPPLALEMKNLLFSMNLQCESSQSPSMQIFTTDSAENYGNTARDLLHNLPVTSVLQVEN